MSPLIRQIPDRWLHILLFDSNKPGWSESEVEALLKSVLFQIIISYERPIFHSIFFLPHFWGWPHVTCLSALTFEVEAIFIGLCQMTTIFIFPLNLRFSKSTVQKRKLDFICCCLRVEVISRYKRLHQPLTFWEFFSRLDHLQALPPYCHGPGSPGTNILFAKASPTCIYAA